MMCAPVSISRLRVAAVVLLALIVAGQLTLHQHSLIPESGGAAPLVCPVCAFDADRASLDTPLFENVLAFAGTVLIEPESHIAPVLFPASGVRGPPLSVC
jgi:hypothetical protein